MNGQEVPALLTFDPEQVMDEWRRLYDWAVLSRQKTECIDTISGLGQKFSGTLSAYRLSKRPQRRERLSRDLCTAFEAMKIFYERLPKKDRLRLPLYDTT